MLTNGKLLFFMGLWKNSKKAKPSQASDAHRALMLPVLRNAKHASTSQMFFQAFRVLFSPVPIHYHLMLIFFIFHPADQYCSTHEGCCPSRSIYAITNRIIMDLICLNAGRTRGGGSVATKFERIKNSEGLLCCLLPSGKMTHSCASSIMHSAPWAGQTPCRSSVSSIRSSLIHTIVFFGSFVLPCGQCCISKSALLALLCMTLDISSQAAHILPLSSAFKDQDTGSAHGKPVYYRWAAWNLSSVSLQPWGRLCPSAAQPELMAAMEASQKCLDQTVWLA